MTTILDRINQATAAVTANNASDLDKLIAWAYWIGQEHATVTVSDEYAALIQEQRQRAANCRYYRMANAIIGEQNYIYLPNYRQDHAKAAETEQTAL